MQQPSVRGPLAEVGDGSLICPGPDGPIPTIRLENVRDGLEDYEYLQRLTDLVDALPDCPLRPEFQALVDEATQLLAIPDSIVDTMTAFTRDPQELIAFRRQVADSILQVRALMEDPDGDGIVTACDICPDTPNAGQEDADADGVGDVCDLYSDTPRRKRRTPMAAPAVSSMTTATGSTTAPTIACPSPTPPMLQLPTATATETPTTPAKRSANSAIRIMTPSEMLATLAPIAQPFQANRRLPSCKRLDIPLRASPVDLTNCTHGS